MKYENKYNEVLKRAKDVLLDCTLEEQKVAEEILLELKESEDERIRKELMDFIYITAFPVKELKKKERFLDWLEKQGEKHLENYSEAEKEKADFVSGQYIECRKSFNEFKEDNSYWLEYVGDDNYIGRSDNILNKKFHITPRQLFTLFTWQHFSKEDSNVNEETNAPTEYGKYVDECLNEASKHFFSNGEDAYSVADLFYAGVRCGKSWNEKQGDTKEALCDECRKEQPSHSCQGITELEMLIRKAR